MLIFKGFITCGFGIKHVGFSMIAFGASSCVSSVLIQGIVKKIGSYKVILVGWFIYASVIIWMFFWKVTSMPYYIVFVTITALGLSENAITSQVHGEIVSSF